MPPARQPTVASRPLLEEEAALESDVGYRTMLDLVRDHLHRIESHPTRENIDTVGRLVAALLEHTAPPPRAPLSPPARAPNRTSQANAPAEERRARARLRAREKRNAERERREREQRVQLVEDIDESRHRAAI